MRLSNYWFRSATSGSAIRRLFTTLNTVKCGAILWERTDECIEQTRCSQEQSGQSIGTRCQCVNRTATRYRLTHPLCRSLSVACRVKASTLLKIFRIAHYCGRPIRRIRSLERGSGCNCRRSPPAVPESASCVPDTPLQPLERGVTVAKARIDDGEVHRRDVSFPGQLL